MTAKIGPRAFAYTVECAGGSAEAFECGIDPDDYELPPQLKQEWELLDTLGTPFYEQCRKVDAILEVHSRYLD